jgi:hypothetical protein
MEVEPKFHSNPHMRPMLPISTTHSHPPDATMHQVGMPAYTPGQEYQVSRLIESPATLIARNAYVAIATIATCTAYKRPSVNRPTANFPNKLLRKFFGFSMLPRKHSLTTGQLEGGPLCRQSQHGE